MNGSRLALLGIEVTICTVAEHGECLATGRSAFMGEMVHGRHRKPLAILSDNIFHHHDAQ